MTQYDIMAYAPGHASRWLRVSVSDSCVTIHGSAEVTNRAMQANFCKHLKQLNTLPECIRKRSWRSLRNEWRAHNLLYRLPLLPSGWKERLKDVDLDDEATWRRAVYAVLAIL